MAVVVTAAVIGACSVAPAAVSAVPVDVVISFCLVVFVEAYPIVAKID